MMIDLYPMFWFLAVITTEPFFVITAMLLVLLFTVIGLTKFVQIIR